MLDITTWMKMATAASLTATAAMSAMPSAADTLAIELPASGVASYFQVDLGASPAHINFVVLSASGSSTAEWQSHGALDEIPSCDAAFAFYPDVTVDITPDHGVYRIAHTFSEDGAFAIADTVAMDLTLPSGTSEGYVSFWNSLRAYFLNTCDGPGATQTCRSCSGGELVLDHGPVLIIDYTPLVATERGSWGSVKARYR